MRNLPGGFFTIWSTHLPGGYGKAERMVSVINHNDIGLVMIPSSLWDREEISNHPGPLPRTSHTRAIKSIV